MLFLKCIGCYDLTWLLWLDSNLFDELKLKKDSYEKWKVVHCTREEYKSITWARGEKIRTAKAQFEMCLARDLKDNKNRLYNYVKSKEKTVETIGLLWNTEGNLVTDDAERVKYLAPS